MKNWKDITVAIVGWHGNMATRYRAILTHMGIKHFGWDKDDEPTEVDATHALICTPTNTHEEECYKLLKHKNIKNILCEKPISLKASDIEALAQASKEVDIRMVCNWKFVNQAIYKDNDIYYDHYNTGKDGFYWDCIQLLYLAGNGKCVLRSKAPVMDCVINERKISLQEIAESYVWMLTHWLIDPERLWSLEDARQATIKTIERIRLETYK